MSEHRRSAGEDEDQAAASKEVFGPDNDENFTTPPFVAATLVEENASENDDAVMQAQVVDFDPEEDADLHTVDILRNQTVGLENGGTVIVDQNQSSSPATDGDSDDLDRLNGERRDVLQLETVQIDEDIQVRSDEAITEEKTKKSISTCCKSRRQKLLWMLVASILIVSILASIPAFRKKSEDSEKSSLEVTFIPSPSPSCESTFRPAASLQVVSNFSHVSMSSKNSKTNAVMAAFKQTEPIFEKLEVGNTISSSIAARDHFDIVDMIVIDDKLVLGLRNYSLPVDTFNSSRVTSPDVVIILRQNETIWHQIGILYLATGSRLLQVKVNSDGKFFAALVYQELSNLVSIQFLRMLREKDELIATGDFSHPTINMNSIIHVSSSKLVVYSDAGGLLLFNAKSEFFQFETFIDLETYNGTLISDLEVSQDDTLVAIFSNSPGSPCALIILTSTIDTETGAATTKETKLFLTHPIRPGAHTQMGALAGNGQSVILVTSFQESENKTQNVGFLYRPLSDGETWAVVDTIELNTGELRDVFLNDPGEQLVVITKDMLQSYDLVCLNSLS